MIYRPIYLSCDVCGIERQPTEGEWRETLASAFKLARSEGWAVRRNGEDIYCPHCMGAPVDIEVNIEIDVQIGPGGVSLVPLD